MGPCVCRGLIVDFGGDSSLGLKQARLTPRLAIVLDIHALPEKQHNLSRAIQDDIRSSQQLGDLADDGSCGNQKGRHRQDVGFSFDLNTQKFHC
jgi:hypothetical protein